MKSKPWTVEGERMLNDVVVQPQSLRTNAKAFNKSVECVKKKMKRLNLKLEVVVPQKIVETTKTSSDSESDKELPNVERQPRVMASEIDARRIPQMSEK